MENHIQQKRLELFPVSARIERFAGTTRLSIGGCDLNALAERYGTPLYLYDGLTLETSVAIYRETLSSAYPGETGLTYAGKAYLCLALASWFTKHGLSLDCSSQGEIEIAHRAGAPREMLIVHGVNKSLADLQAAQRYAGTVVVDHLDELEQLAELSGRSNGYRPEIWLRWRPGQTVETHAYTLTGHTESKFGMSSEELHLAINSGRDRGLRITGFHFHLGSQFRDLQPLGHAIETALELLADLRKTSGWSPEVFCPGGGWGVAYHEDELPHPPVEPYIRLVAERVISGCRSRGLALPRLQLEPGRSLVARAGVALYRAGSIKRSDARHWVLVDGGLADNPRPALYGARYSALPVVGLERPFKVPVTLGGPYCESGDILIEAIPMPEIHPGELIAVPVSGAYQLSMSSNYNGARRPAVLWCAGGAAKLMQHRERLEDLHHRDVRMFGGRQRRMRTR